MKFSAVIFDLDGTLVDTETLLEESNKQLCAKYGKTYDPPAFRARAMAHPEPEYTALLKEVCGLPGAVEELVKERRDFYFKAQDERGIKFKPGAEKLLQALKARGLRLALATSSDRIMLNRVLEKMSLTKTFDVVVDASQIAHGKPAPDIYLETARQLKVKPAECMAIDDAPSGIVSAKAAGMYVIGLLDRRYAKELPGADRVVESLEEVSGLSF